MPEPIDDLRIVETDVTVSLEDPGSSGEPTASAMLLEPALRFENRINAGELIPISTGRSWSIGGFDDSIVEMVGFRSSNLVRLKPRLLSNYKYMAGVDTSGINPKPIWKSVEPYDAAPVVRSSRVVTEIPLGGSSATVTIGGGLTLILGLSNSGKTPMAKAIAHRLDLPTLRWGERDPGAIIPLPADLHRLALDTLSGRSTVVDSLRPLLVINDLLPPSETGSGGLPRSFINFMDFIHLLATHGGSTVVIVVNPQVGRSALSAVRENVLGSASTHIMLGVPRTSSQNEKRMIDAAISSQIIRGWTISEHSGRRASNFSNIRLDTGESK